MPPFKELPVPPAEVGSFNRYRVSKPKAAVTKPRRARFDPERRGEVKAVRNVRACLRCALLKLKCSHHDICLTCEQLAFVDRAHGKKVLAFSGCIRTKLQEVSVFQICEEARSNFQLMLYAITLAYTQPTAPEKHCLSISELLKIGAVAGHSFLKVLDGRLKPLTLGHCTREELEALFLLIFGTILAGGYFQPHTSETISPGLKLVPGMQRHLCQILAHYLVYFGSQLRLDLPPGADKIIIEAAASRWNRKGAFLWQTKHESEPESLQDVENLKSGPFRMSCAISSQYYRSDTSCKQNLIPPLKHQLGIANCIPNYLSGTSENSEAVFGPMSGLDQEESLLGMDQASSYLTSIEFESDLRRQNASVNIVDSLDTYPTRAEGTGATPWHNQNGHHIGYHCHSMLAPDLLQTQLHEPGYISISTCYSAPSDSNNLIQGPPNYGLIGAYHVDKQMQSEQLIGNFSDWTKESAADSGGWMGIDRKAEPIDELNTSEAPIWPSTVEEEFLLV